jgi:hypothetical protein
MPCIDISEVAYLNGYLPLSAWVHTRECDIIFAHFAVTKLVAS